MTNPFNIGDKVRRVSGLEYSGIVKGNIYTVSRVISESVISLTEISDVPNAFNVQHFAFVEKSKKPNQTGFSKFIRKVESDES